MQNGITINGVEYEAQAIEVLDDDSPCDMGCAFSDDTMDCIVNCPCNGFEEVLNVENIIFKRAKQ